MSLSPTEIETEMPDQIAPPEGGLSVTSYVKCEDIRSISTARLTHKRGTLSPATVDIVEEKVRLLLGL